MFRWNPGISPERIREERDEAPAWDRHRIIRQHLPLIYAALERAPHLVRPLRLAFRRAVIALEGRAISVDEEPGLKHAFHAKEVGSLLGFFGALGFELLIGILICIQVLGMRAVVAVTFGLAITGFVALQAKAVAATAVEFERLAGWKRWLVICGAASFAAALIALALLYGSRNGVLPSWVISVVTPLLPVILGIGSTAFAALANVYGHPRRIYEEVERLEGVRTGLHALKVELESELAGAARPTSRVGAKSARRSARRRILNGVATGLMGLLIAGVLTGFVMPGAHAAPSGGERHLYLMPDATNTGDQSEEEARIRQLLGTSIGELCEALGDVSEVVVLPWGDAASVWRSGEVFGLPRPQPAAPIGEARIEFFRPAYEQQRRNAWQQVLEARKPVYQEIRRSLVAPPAAAATRSCVTEALNRAVGLPAGTVVLLPTDLTDYRCRATPRPAAAGTGAVVCVIAIPRREGVGLRERMRERREAIAREYPSVLLVDSFELTGPGSLRRLAERLRERAREVGP